MADKQGPAAPGATETKDDLINGALVNTGELSDGALDQVAGGLKYTLNQVFVSNVSSESAEPAKPPK